MQHLTCWQLKGRISVPGRDSLSCPETLKPILKSSDSLCHLCASFSERVQIWWHRAKAGTGFDVSCRFASLACSRKQTNHLTHCNKTCGTNMLIRCIRKEVWKESARVCVARVWFNAGLSTGCGERSVIGHSPWVDMLCCCWSSASRDTNIILLHLDLTGGAGQLNKPRGFKTQLGPKDHDMQYTTQYNYSTLKEN